MKHVWSADDIIVGRIVCKPRDKKTTKACGWSAKWTLKIGYLPSNDSGSNYVTIAMTDGMVCGPHSAKEMADMFNKDEMIPMPHKWLQETIDYLRDMFEGV